MGEAIFKSSQFFGSDRDIAKKTQGQKQSIQKETSYLHLDSAED